MVYTQSQFIRRSCSLQAPGGSQRLDNRAARSKECRGLRWVTLGIYVVKCCQHSDLTIGTWNLNKGIFDIQFMIVHMVFCQCSGQPSLNSYCFASMVYTQSQFIRRSCSLQAPGGSQRLDNRAARSKECSGLRWVTLGIYVVKCCQHSDLTIGTWNLNKGIFDIQFTIVHMVFCQRSGQPSLNSYCFASMVYTQSQCIRRSCSLQAPGGSQRLDNRAARSKECRGLRCVTLGIYVVKGCQHSDLTIGTWNLDKGIFDIQFTIVHMVFCQCSGQPSLNSYCFASMVYTQSQFIRRSCSLQAPGGSQRLDKRAARSKECRGLRCVTLGIYVVKCCQHSDLTIGTWNLDKGIFDIQFTIVHMVFCQCSGQPSLNSYCFASMVYTQSQFIRRSCSLQAPGGSQRLDNRAARSKECRGLRCVTLGIHVVKCCQHSDLTIGTWNLNKGIFDIQFTIVHMVFCQCSGQPSLNSYCFASMVYTQSQFIRRSCSLQAPGGSQRLDNRAARSKECRGLRCVTLGIYVVKCCQHSDLTIGTWNLNKGIFDIQFTIVHMVFCQCSGQSSLNSYCFASMVYTQSQFIRRSCSLQAPGGSQRLDNRAARSKECRGLKCVTLGIHVVKCCQHSDLTIGTWNLNKGIFDIQFTIVHMVFCQCSGQSSLNSYCFASMVYTQSQFIRRSCSLQAPGGSQRLDNRAARSKECRGLRCVTLGIYVVKCCQHSDLTIGTWNLNKGICDIQFTIVHMVFCQCSGQPSLNSYCFASMVYTQSQFIRRSCSLQAPGGSQRLDNRAARSKECRGLRCVTLGIYVVKCCQHSDLTIGTWNLNKGIFDIQFTIVHMVFCQCSGQPSLNSYCFASMVYTQSQFIRRSCSLQAPGGSQRLDNRAARSKECRGLRCVTLGIYVVKCCQHSDLTIGTWNLNKGIFDIQFTIVHMVFCQCSGQPSLNSYCFASMVYTQSQFIRRSCSLQAPGGSQRLGNRAARSKECRGLRCGWKL